MRQSEPTPADLPVQKFPLKVSSWRVTTLPYLNVPNLYYAAPKPEGRIIPK